MFIDERGILNRDLGGADYALKQLSQPLQPSHQDLRKTEKASLRSVSFDPSTRFNATQFREENLEGDKILPMTALTKDSPKSIIKKSSKEKPSEKSSGFLTNIAKFESTIKEDPLFNEREYHKQKKQLLEKYWTKKITVIQTY